MSYYTLLFIYIRISSLILEFSQRFCFSVFLCSYLYNILIFFQVIIHSISSLQAPLYLLHQLELISSRIAPQLSSLVPPIIDLSQIHDFVVILSFPDLLPHFLEYSLYFLGKGVCRPHLHVRICLFPALTLWDSLASIEFQVEILFSKTVQAFLLGFSVIDEKSVVTLILIPLKMNWLFALETLSIFPLFLMFYK